MTQKKKSTPAKKKVAKSGATKAKKVTKAAAKKTASKSATTKKVTKAAARVSAKATKAANAEAAIAADADKEWQKRMKKFDEKFRKYSMKHNYNEGEGIDHKNFGKGFVTKIQPRKIEVLFQDKPRLLIQGLN